MGGLRTELQAPVVISALSNLRRHLHTIDKVLNFNIFGSFQKNEYFWGYEDFVAFLGSSQKWTIVLWVIYAFRVFS